MRIIIAMLFVFGVASADVIPYTDTFVTPTNDVTVNAGEKIEVILTDAHQGELFLRPVNKETAEISLNKNSSEKIRYSISTENITPGKYVLRVEADDNTYFGPMITILDSGIGKAELPSIYAQPNPFDLSGSDATMRFANLPSGSTVRIYDMSGREVIFLDAGNNLWEGRNEAGEIVAAGTYMFYIDGNGGTTTTGKIAVIK